MLPNNEISALTSSETDLFSGSWNPAHVNASLIRVTVLLVIIFYIQLFLTRECLILFLEVKNVWNRRQQRYEATV